MTERLAGWVRRAGTPNLLFKKKGILETVREFTENLKETSCLI